MNSVGFFELTGIDASKGAHATHSGPCARESAMRSLPNKCKLRCAKAPESCCKMRMQQNNRPDLGANDEVSVSRQSARLRGSSSAPRPADPNSAGSKMILARAQ